MSQPDRNFSLRPGHRPAGSQTSNEATDVRLRVWQGRLEAAGSAESLAKEWGYQTPVQTFRLPSNLGSLNYK